ncbi:MAG: FlhB domain protein [Cyanobacteria bacterium RYN_339]|nr:FlhB domain protein [Cyanobacteria bacterium RYN_339]
MTDASKKPIKRAVALRYDQGADDAPRVVASGQGLIAEKIVQTAKDAGVTIEHDPALAEALAQVELGTAIPEELYPVVAEVLVFIGRMNREKGKRKRTEFPKGNGR